MEINVLGISASPRKANSHYMLEEALGECSAVRGGDTVKTEIFSFQGRTIGPCISCYRCWDGSSGGRCILNDDFEGLREKWLAADVVIYAVPIYHLSVPGQLKCFWDRLGNAMYTKFPKPSCRHLKTIGCLAQGMHLHSGHELAIQSVIMHAVLMKCLPIAGDGWHSYTGAAAWTGLKEDDDALQRLEREDADEVTRCGMTAAKSVVRRCITVARIIRNGGLAMQAELGEDERFIPFLRRVREELA